MSTLEQDLYAGTVGAQQPAQDTPTEPAPVQTSNPVTPRDRVHQIAADRNIPADVADDYLRLTGQVESGNRQYNSSGQVLKGPKTNRGDSAFGMGQVMADQPGGHVRTIDGERFDLRDPDQNVAAGLSYFHQGGDDPIERRLYYFGGPGARARYRKTGRIPTGGDGYTSFADYVRKSGGYEAAKHDPEADLAAGTVPSSDLESDLAAGTNLPSSVVRANDQTAIASPQSGPTSPIDAAASQSPEIASAQNAGPVYQPQAQPVSSPTIQQPQTSAPPTALAKGVQLNPFQEAAFQVWRRNNPNQVLSEDEQRAEYQSTLNPKDIEAQPGDTSEFSQPAPGYAAEQAKYSQIDTVNKEAVDLMGRRQVALQRYQAAARKRASEASKQRAAAVETLRGQLLADAEKTAEHADPDLAAKLVDQVKNYSPAEVIKAARNSNQIQGQQLAKATMPLKAVGFNPPSAAARIISNQSQAQQIQAPEDVQKEKDQIREMVVSRSGGPDTIARVKSDYQKLGRDTNRIDASINNQVEAEYNRRQMSKLTDQDRADITASAQEMVNLPGVLRGLNIGAEKAAIQIPRAAAGMVRMLGDLTGSESIKNQATMLGKVVAKRSAAQEEAHRSLGGVNSAVASTGQVVGDVFQLVAESSILGPEVAMGAGGGLQTLGQGGTYAQAAGATVKGAAYGNLFRYLPMLEKYPQARSIAQKVTNLGTDAAAVGAGTYAIERASGASHDDALKTAATNAAASGLMRMTQIIPDLPVVQKAVEAARAQAGKIAEPIVAGKNTPEWLRQPLSKLTQVENFVVHTPEGKAMSVYYDPKSDGLGGTEIKYSADGDYGERRSLEITPEQFDYLAKRVKSVPPDRFGGVSPDRQLPPEPPKQITEKASPGEARPPRTRPPVTPKETAQAQTQAQEENKQQALNSLARANAKNVPEDVNRFIKEARHHGATSDEIDAASGRPTQESKLAPAEKAPRLAKRTPIADTTPVDKAMKEFVAATDDVNKEENTSIDLGARNRRIGGISLGVSEGDGGQVAGQLTKLANQLKDIHESIPPRLEALSSAIQRHVSDEDALAHVDQVRTGLERAGKPTVATETDPGRFHTSAKDLFDPFLDAAIERGLISRKTLLPVTSGEEPTAEPEAEEPAVKGNAAEGVPLEPAERRGGERRLLRTPVEQERRDKKAERRRGTREQIKRLRTQAETDPLTGLGNVYALKKAQATVPVGAHVIHADLDNLTAVNEGGHDKGDEYLKSAASHLKEAYGQVFRFGGKSDEFIAYDTKSKSTEEAQAKWDAVEKDYRAQHGVKLRGRSTGISGGVAKYDGDHAAAIKQADRNEIAAKVKGKIARGEPLKKEESAYVEKQKGKGEANAVETGLEPKNDIGEHQRVPRGADVQPHPEQVREGGGEQAGSRGGVEHGEKNAPGNGTKAEKPNAATSAEVSPAENGPRGGHGPRQRPEQGQRSGYDVETLKKRFPVGSQIEFRQPGKAPLTGRVQHHREDAVTKNGYMLVNGPDGKEHEVGLEEKPRRLDKANVEERQSPGTPIKPKIDFGALFDEEVAAHKAAEEKPAPSMRPEKAVKTPKPKSGKAPRVQESEPSQWRLIGKNSQGENLYEDQRGVRSTTDSGARITQEVTLTPTRAENGGIIYKGTVSHSGRWELAPKEAPRTMADIADLVNDIFGAGTSFSAAPAGWESHESGPIEAPTFTVDRNRIGFDNPAGPALLTRAYRNAGVKLPTSGAAGAFERKPQAIIKSLTDLAAIGVEGAASLAAAVRQAVAGSPMGRVLFHYGERALRHELFHEASTSSESVLEERHADFGPLIQDTTFHRALVYLLRKGYNGSMPSMVEEAAAHMADGRYADMGLSRTEALDWLTKWFESFYSTHPQMTVAQFREQTNETAAARDAGYTRAKSAQKPEPGKNVRGLQGERETGNRRGPPETSFALGEAPPQFDAGRYAKLKPALDLAIKLFADLEPGEAMVRMMRELRDQHNVTADKLAAMRPYVVQFMEERTAGEENDARAHESATSPQNEKPQPTEGQIKAGNYAKGHMNVAGMDFSIENPAGSSRSGVDPRGKPWSVEIHSHYGYIKKTEGADGEHVDAYVKPGTHPDYDGPIFVVNQVKGNGHFDEHKVMIGWPTLEEAKAGYAENYTKGWRVGDIASFEDPQAFKEWLKSEDQTIPADTPLPKADQAIAAQIKAIHPHSEPWDWADQMLRDETPESVHNALVDALRMGVDPSRSDDLNSLGSYIAALEADPEYRAAEAMVGNVAPGLDRTSKKVENESDAVTAQTGNDLASGDIRPGGISPADADNVAGMLGGGQSESLTEAGGDADVAPDLENVGSATGTGAGNEGNANAPLGPRTTGNGGIVNAPARRNFTITDELDFHGIGDRTKYANNIAAIELLHRLTADHREATPEEQSVLARYVGWGGMKGVFDSANKSWKDQYHELKNLLTPEEYAAANSSVTDAHYTSGTIIDGVWKAVKRFGFERGSVLESTMGVGHFFGLMPGGMRKTSSLTGVEEDRITGGIAKQLYPLADIHAPIGLQDVRLPKEQYDLSVGNPPFGDQSLYDSDNPDISKFKIHAFVIAKSIESLRPGGILVNVVSKGLLDATDPKAVRARQWLSQHARLVGAIRLPDTAFKENAGTEVTTDIVFLQKLGPSIERNAPEWFATGKIKDPDSGDPINLNQYFVDHPEMMLGTMELKGTMYRGKSPTLVPFPGKDLGGLLEQAIERLPEDIYKTAAKTSFEMEQDANRTLAPSEEPPYSYFVENGKVKQKMPDSLGGGASGILVNLKGKTLDRMKALIDLRQKTRTLLNAETKSDPVTSDAELAKQRKVLSATYDRFVGKYGLLGTDTNKRLFREDADFPLLLSLEKKFDKGISPGVAKKEGVPPRAPSAIKADIFRERTVDPTQQVKTVNSAQDALVASLNERGKVDLDYMQSIYDKVADQIIEALGDQIYHDPALKEYQETDEYLSGDVKTKLVEARIAASEDATYERNVKALEAVIPKDVAASEIFAKLGSTWVPVEDYAAFAQEKFSGVLRGSFNATVAQWVGLTIHSRDDVANRSTWGTKEMGADSIMEIVMKNGQPVVSYIDEEGKRVIRQDETVAAQGKAKEMTEEFANWIFDDGDRRSRLVDIYNEKLNRIVNRVYSGKDLVLPGKNKNITLRPHQLKAIVRALRDGNILLDHVVGAGKTYVIAAIAMELRRLGLAKKPMITVPNHLVDQWASEFKQLYPGANILAASRADFTKSKRRQLFARIATGNWDAVIVAHSSFGFIPVPPDTELAILDEQKAELMAALAAMGQEGDRYSIRDLELAKEKIENKIKKLADRTRDKAIDFAQLGIDALFVDEAHEYKNLFYVTSKKGVAGLGKPEGSAKAFDLFIKTRYLHMKNGGRGVFFATGTPVANSIAEVFHMQRYLQYDLLKQREMANFDAWANTFGQDVIDWEMDAAGRFKEKCRFSKFANLPELKQMWKSVADVVVRQNLLDDAIAQGKVFPIPKIKGGKPENVVLDRSSQQAEYIGVERPRLDSDGNQMYDEETGVPLVSYDTGTIIDRLDHWKENVKFDPREIPLKITGDARKAGLDFRLINANAADFATSKSNTAVDRIVEIHRRNEDRKGTQLVFCDLSTPKKAKGKATEEADTKQPAFFTQTSAGLTHVDGAKKLKLISRPDAEFFYVNSGNDFVISEVSTGLRVASGKTLQKAKDAANAGISGLKAGSWNEMMRTHKIPQDKIDAYLAKWEERRQEALANAPDEERGEDEGAPEEAVDPVDQEADISLDDLLADQGGPFSVYEDMRSKLIGAGIPEDQIAFIHDFNSDVQKQSLFNNMNSGKVRILLGSTKKMGAGMNVQRRLVALHHMDAPYRPADLEQREGRIIRQGNLFYEQDPEGFEVEIYRYATKQTYDSRMWEIIEIKARAIETFKTDDSVREIEDISSESANAAEMKAGASGDPRILQSIQLKTAIRTLEAQEKNFRRSKFDLEDKIRRFEKKENYPFGHKAEAEAVLKHAGEKSKENIITIGKIKKTVEESATEEGSKELAAAFQSLLKDLPKGAKRPIGNFRGLTLEMEDQTSDLRVNFVRGSDLVSFALYKKPRIDPDDPTGKTVIPGEKISISGLITRLDNAIARQTANIEKANEEIEALAKQTEKAREELKKPWPKADELASLREQQKKLVAELRGGRSNRKAGEEVPLPDTLDGLDREIERVKDALLRTSEVDPKDKKLRTQLNERLEKATAAREKRRREGGAVRVGTAPTGYEPTPSGPTLRSLYQRVIHAYSALRGHGPEPKNHFSAIGHWRDIAVGGLSEIERANAPTFDAAVRASGARTTGIMLMRRAANQIQRVLVTKDGWLRFLTLITQSRLYGVRDRWNEFALLTNVLDDEEFRRFYAGDEGAETGIRPVVEMLDKMPWGKTYKEGEGFEKSDSIAGMVDTLLATDDINAARSYLSNLFATAADSVAELMPESEFNAETNTTRFQAALQVYKNLLERPMAEAHSLNEGIFSDALGPLDSFIPLTALDEDGNLLHRMRTRVIRGNEYKIPQNPRNKFATGLSPAYDPSPEALGKALSLAERKNSVADMLRTMMQEGLLVKLKKNEVAPKEMEWQGETYRAKTIALGNDRTIYVDGRTVHVAAPRAIIPYWLHKELQPLLEEGDYSQSIVRALMSTLNLAGMSGPIDLVAHVANITGALVVGTPYVGTSILSKTIGNTPVTKLLNSWLQMVLTDPWSDEAVQDIEEMSKLGLIPSRYASTASAWLRKGRSYAHETGAHKSWALGPLMYGPGGIDIRARLLMYRLTKYINPNATVAETRRFVNQLGNYNFETTGAIEMFLKQYGFAPFFTAGSTMWRVGIGATFGLTPLPTGDLTLAQRSMYRIAMLLSAGIIGMLGVWILIYRGYTGLWPWDDKRSRLLSFPLSDHHRHTWLANKIYGDNEKTAYVGMGIFSPLIQRGLAATGITNSYNALMEGATGGQAQEEAERGVINGLIHPFTSGPVTHSLLVTLTGKEPYLTNMRDITGEQSMTFLPGSRTKQPGLPQWKENAIEGVANLNSFYGNLARNVGFTQSLFDLKPNGNPRDTGEKANPWLRMGLDLAFPRLINTPQDLGSTENRFIKQEKAITSSERREEGLPKEKPKSATGAPKGPPRPKGLKFHP